MNPSMIRMHRRPHTGPGRLGSDAAAGNSHSWRCAARCCAAVRLCRVVSILGAASKAGWPPLPTSEHPLAAARGDAAVVGLIAPAGAAYWRGIAGGLIAAVTVTDTCPRSGWVSTMVTVNRRWSVPWSWRAIVEIDTV